MSWGGYTIDLNPNPRMACQDCAWSARAEAGRLACLAVEHLSCNPGHRLSYSEPFSLTAPGVSALPRHSPYSEESSG